MSIRLPPVFPIYFEESDRVINRRGNSLQVSVPPVYGKDSTGTVKTIILSHYLIYYPKMMERAPQEVLIDLALKSVNALINYVPEEREELEKIWVELKKIEDRIVVEPPKTD